MSSNTSPRHANDTHILFLQNGFMCEMIHTAIIAHEFVKFNHALSPTPWALPKQISCIANLNIESNQKKNVRETSNTERHGRTAYSLFGLGALPIKALECMRVKEPLPVLKRSKSNPNESWHKKNYGNGQHVSPQLVCDLSPTIVKRSKLTAIASQK